jgi:hypothetical protein
VGLGRGGRVLSLQKDDYCSALGVIEAFLFLLRSLALVLKIPYSDFPITALSTDSVTP